MSQPSSRDRSNEPRYYLLAFVLPMAVYMLLGSLEPSPPEIVESAPLAPSAIDSPVTDEVLPEESQLEDFGEPVERNWLGLAIPGRYYPVVYTIKVVATLGVFAWFWPAYRQFPFRVSPLAFVVGVVGVVLWVGIASLGLEQRLFSWLGSENFLTQWFGSEGRPAYNPLAALGDQPALAYAFLAVRFLGLALLVPLIEEAFLRAFLMRYVMHENWTEIPFGVVNRMAVAVGILFPVLYHPEHLAALVWFSLVTWLMVRTKNYWDCVAAHATTNLLLGIYVVAASAWQLW